jgi:NitT/TauT family transport system substrate-binding protein
MDCTRREFVSGLTLAGTAGLLGVWTKTAGGAEPPPETTRLRLIRVPTICGAPQYIAEELLRDEGFTDVQYFPKAGGADVARALASGECDLSGLYAAPLIIQVDRGDPITIVGGIHSGCFELFGTERVQAIRDLKGKTVAIIQQGSAEHVFLASMVAYVGMDPRRDVNFAAYPRAEGQRLLAEGKVDAYLGFPPDPQELRERRIGHLVVNSAVDRPWSQYFCCMLAGNREFVRRHPVATKRVLRAILKATNICALEPERVAGSLVDRGLTPRRDWALQSLTSIPYNRWREYDPEDTVRFYALRLREAGMIKSTPQKIIAQGTDWRFLNELKKELKG